MKEEERDEQKTTDEGRWEVKIDYLSDEDEKWSLEPSVQPLANVFTFGWTEDGRCGYDADAGQSIQMNPRPIPSLRIAPSSLPLKSKGVSEARYVCKSVSAGSRHTLLLMVDCTPLPPLPNSSSLSPSKLAALPKRAAKVMITGLNQVGLCEEKGHMEPVDITTLEYDYNDRPVSVVAGRGTSFIVTERGHLYSFGHGNLGVLGHGDCFVRQTPTRVSGLSKMVVRNVAVGGSHAIALTNHSEMYSWGRNDKGQLGLGFESKYEVNMQKIVIPNLAKYELSDVSCGFEHSIALVTTVANRQQRKESTVFCWGDESRGQLGSGDAVNRMRPQENRWLTRFLRSGQMRLQRVIAGGHHNLALIRSSGQVISWGANTYGQLGNGFQWDDPAPKIINSLKSVIYLSAGLRHNVAVSDAHGHEVFTWGYNAYGELGLGDTDVRLQPTKVTAMKKNTKVFSVSSGERHSVVVTSHKPITAKHDAVLRPYFKIAETENKRAVINQLKWTMKKKGIDPALLDDPHAVLPNQIGSNDKALKNEVYAKGLRYCLDTYEEEFDWRRKSLESCFECYTKTLHLQSVCLSCARNCLSSYSLRPYIKQRKKGDVCDCRTSGLCQCIWSNVRAQFDVVVDNNIMNSGDMNTISSSSGMNRDVDNGGEEEPVTMVVDTCIAPSQVRGLLKILRAPYPVEGADVEDCLLNVAEGREDEYYPRIGAVAFEKWFRKYFDEKLEENHSNSSSNVNNNKKKIK